MPIAWPGGTSSWKSPIWVSTNSRPDAAAARRIARFHVGGWARRWARTALRLALADFFCSSGEDLRPVRPRVSIVPAAFPRCLDLALALGLGHGLGV